MLTVVPMTVVLLGMLGVAVIMASVARIVALELQQRPPVDLLGDPGPTERPRVAA